MTAPLHFRIDHVDTPIGRFALVADDEGRLRAAGFTEGHRRMERELRARSGAPAIELTPSDNPSGLTSAIAAYFAGALRAIDDVPTFVEGTDFQRAVWRALREIPCGETWSYGQLARHIGSPSAVRAVGLANGSNPVGVIVPCHRVIGADGSMTGYGGGIERKKWLLAHERAMPRSAQRGLWEPLSR